MSPRETKASYQPTTKDATAVTGIINIAMNPGAASRARGPILSTVYYRHYFHREPTGHAFMHSMQ